jgi:hypothetical protein
MVDTKDLKSFGHCGCAGSSPASSTNWNANCFIIKWLAFFFYGFWRVFGVIFFECGLGE